MKHAKRLTLNIDKPWTINTQNQNTAIAKTASTRDTVVYVTEEAIMRKVKHKFILNSNMSKALPPGGAFFVPWAYAPRVSPGTLTGLHGPSGYAPRVSPGTLTGLHCPSGLRPSGKLTFSGGDTLGRESPSKLFHKLQARTHTD